MKYLVIYERAADGGIWGYAPDLPGATGMGETLDEARESVTAGIAIWIDEMRKSGRPIPEPATVGSELVEISAAASLDLRQHIAEQRQRNRQ
jgi:predicted RNase H-like HicB family nuclease